MSVTGKRGTRPAHDRPKWMQHGTYASYNFGCRCHECTKANRIYQRQIKTERAAAAAEGLIEVPHGTENGYTGYRCRCTDCTEASRIAKNARNARRRAVAS